jgi:myo-inositol-1(or 4)-monophosphatase
VAERAVSYAQEYALAVATAREAGALLREKFGNVRDIRYKGLVDPVTEADAASEALIADRLLTAFPGDRLLAEEGSASMANTASERVWIVDPLDGTTNFMHGYPVFCISIGLHVAGEPRVGVVFDPLRDELFAAIAGQGATLNDAPIAVSGTRELLRAMLATGFAYDPNRRLENIPYFQRFVELTQAVRRDGAAALDIASVAAGRFDGFWERGVSVWDVAAAALILTEAGGRLSDYDGGAYDPYGREIVASNAHLHPAMLAAIAEVGATQPQQAVDYT